MEKVDNNSKNKKDLLKLNRRKFYKRLGFRDLNCELYLFGVSYMPCVLDITNEELNEELVMQEIFKIYSSVIGKYTNKFCKVKYM